MPAFVSRDELDEFLALLKLSPYLPPIDAVYHGITKTVREWEAGQILLSFHRFSCLHVSLKLFQMLLFSSQIWEQNNTMHLPRHGNTPKKTKSWHIFCLDLRLSSIRHSLSCKEVERNVSVLHQRNSSFTCGLMLLYNLAKPKLTFVHCKTRYVRDIFCVIQRNSIHGPVEPNKMNKTSCERYSFRHSIFCLFPSWRKVQHTAKVSTRPKSNLPLLSFFQAIFDAVDALSFPRILNQDYSTTTYFVRFLNIYTWKSKPANATSGAFTLGVLPARTLKPRGNLFHCSDSFFISTIFLCNGRSECPENKDEQKCNFGDKNACSALFYMTPSETCKIFLDKDQLQKPGEAWLPNTHCIEYGMLACVYNKLCYSLSQVCIYQLNENGILSPCHFGEHLQLCKNFECNTLFKCPGYYYSGERPVMAGGIAH